MSNLREALSQYWLNTQSSLFPWLTEATRMGEHLETDRLNDLPEACNVGYPRKTARVVKSVVQVTNDTLMRQTAASP